MKQTQKIPQRLLAQNSRLITFRRLPDELWKKAQTEPFTGEGEIHFTGKRRLREILSRSGFYAELEHRFLCPVDGLDEALELRSDVYAVSPERIICCEVDGPRGHKTTRAHKRDDLKKRRIKSIPGNSTIEFFTFHYKRLIGRKAWTDKEIAEEMKIDTLDKPRTKWVGP